MSLEMISVAAIAEKWNVSVRTVQQMCADGRIPGARQFGGSWQIPADSPRPADGRSLRWKKERWIHQKMPRKSPMLCMTNLYHTPGCAEETAQKLQNNPDAKLLFDAGIAYACGKIDQTYEILQFALSDQSRYYFAISGVGFLLSMCAIWRGDMVLWNEARQLMYATPCDTETERATMSLILIAADSSVFNYSDYPEWFVRGNFERLPADTHPMAKIFYAKYLYMVAYSLAVGDLELEGVQGLALMGMIGNTLEPLITQAVVDRTIIPEIHLRLWCATVYYNSGKKELAVSHIDQAIARSLPDKLYGILAEHWRQLDKLLSKRLALVDPEAEKAVRELYRTFLNGQAQLGGQIRRRNIVTNLSQREREVAKLVAFRFTNKQIAAHLNISESTVKTTVQNIMKKTGLQSRSEFGSVL